MSIKQMSVFIENKQGRLAEFAKLLGDHQIDMLALSIADTTDFGILRVIVGDNEKAVRITREAGYTVALTEVLAIAVSDRPGGTCELLSLLNENNISVEYAYSFVRHIDGSAVVIFRVDQPEKTVPLLQAAHIRMLTQEEIGARSPMRTGS